MKYGTRKERHQELKRVVLTHYGGGKCACVRCGFADIRALSLDHVAGGGNRDKRHKGSQSLYRFLAKSGYPLGFQTLCMNCQFIKRVENKEDYWQGERLKERMANLKEESKKPLYLTKVTPKNLWRYINKLPHLVFDITSLKLAFGIKTDTKLEQRLYTFLTRANQDGKLKRVSQGVYERIIPNINT